MPKKYDLVVKVGEYTKDGQTKSRTKNIGVIMENDKGMFMLLDKTFNPAGVPSTGDKERIVVSMYEDKPRSNDAPAGNYTAKDFEQEDLSDEVPF